MSHPIHMVEHAISRPQLRFPLPDPTLDEPDSLIAFRSNAADEKLFMQLRREFREREDWASLAKLCVLHASESTVLERSVELSVQAYELFLERLHKKPMAAHALARAMWLSPTDLRCYERLHALYLELNWQDELTRLIRLRIDTIQRDPTNAHELPNLHIELAEIQRSEFSNIPYAIENYQRALAIDPYRIDASEQLIAMHLQAGAWQLASDYINQELDRLSPETHAARIADLHLVLANLEISEMKNLAGGARHLQAAIKLVPEHLPAMKCFASLYLRLDDPKGENRRKAASVYTRAAQIAHEADATHDAIRLLQRALELDPHYERAASTLEPLLIEQRAWDDLRSHYGRCIEALGPHDSLETRIKLAQLLETELGQHHAAQRCYEEASKYEQPGGTASKALERIYQASGDWYSLAMLFDRQVERHSGQASIELLLAAARIHSEYLDDPARAAVYYHKILERDPFNEMAAEGYKEHFRRRHGWTELRDLILFRLELAASIPGPQSPLQTQAQKISEELVELADICERRLGDIAGAIGAWRKMNQFFPHDSRPAEQISRIEKRTAMWDGMLATQEADLSNITDQDRKIDTLKRLAQIYRDRYVDPAHAIDLYGQILSIRPGDIMACRALTALHERAGNFDTVIELLKEQCEISRSNTERITLLRRMADIWHHQLHQPNEAIWAYEQILTLTPKNAEALHQLQLIFSEQNQHDQLVATIQRELQVTTKIETKIVLLRKMAQIQTYEMRDHAGSCKSFQQLRDLVPDKIPIYDRLIDVLIELNRYEDVAKILQDCINSAKTPPVRKLDYLRRLGQLALDHLGDLALARSAYERALAMRSNDQESLEQLADLYRRHNAFPELETILAELYKHALTDEAQYELAWERAEILAEQLENIQSAVAVLRSLSNNPNLSREVLNEKLLEYLSRASMPRELIAEAELALLGTTTAEARRQLFELISNTWIALGNKEASLASYRRCMEEFVDDPAGLWRLANLQVETGDIPGALASLQRRTEVVEDSGTRIETLDKMAQLCEQSSEVDRAFSLLQQAIHLDIENEDVWNRLRQFAQSHNRWQHLLDFYEFRFDARGDHQDIAGQQEICGECAHIAEQFLQKPAMAFDWARRGYFLDHEDTPKRSPLLDRMRELAEKHDLWPAFVDTKEQELALHLQEEVDTDFDFVAIYLEAADLAENRVGDPHRAIRLLEQGLELFPSENSLSDLLTKICEDHGIWPPLIQLHVGQIHRSATGLGRFDAYCAIANIYQQRLGDPRSAFAWLRRAWKDLADTDETLGRELLEKLTHLGSQHELWELLAQHHDEIANEHFASDQSRQGVNSLMLAASILEDQVQRPLEALRILVARVDQDPTTTQILPRIEKLSLAVDDANAGADLHLGARIELEAIARLISSCNEPDQQIEWLTRRAQIRMDRFQDPVGALAEWSRVLLINFGDEQARYQIKQLLENDSLAHFSLFFPAWECQATNDPNRRAELFKELASIYENRLSRPEYALRSRIQAWRIAPELPQIEELDEDHLRLWELAKRVGNYSGPSLPDESLLAPKIPIPEREDLQLWEALELDPEKFFQPLSLWKQSIDELINKDYPGDPDEEQNREERSISGIGTIPAEESVRPLLAEETLEEIEEIEEIEEVDLIDENDIVIDGIDIENSEEHTIAVEHNSPPPIPGRFLSGHPAVPTLSHDILPPRPRLSSAWDELASAYAVRSNDNLETQIEVMMLQARLWEDSAENIENAFLHHEQALTMCPEDEAILASIQQLANRHDARARLMKAYEHLLGKSTHPEYSIALGLRLASLQRQLNLANDAVTSYRDVLELDHQHVVALQALAEIYRELDEIDEYAEVCAQLLEILRFEFDDEERIERTMELVDLYANRLNRQSDAIAALRFLIDDFNGYRPAHELLIDLLMGQEQWVQAITAMRTATDGVDDAQWHGELLARMAEIYENYLQLPDRAIETWQTYRDIYPADTRALEQLQRLYVLTDRYDHLLPVIEGQLLHAGDDVEQTSRLLLLKGRMLATVQHDKEAALNCLRQIPVPTFTDPDFVLDLAQLFASCDALDEGVNALSIQIESTKETGGQEREALFLGIAKFVTEVGENPTHAAEFLDSGIQEFPTSETLLRFRSVLAKQLGDYTTAVEHLQSIENDLAAQIEAAEISRDLLDDNSRSAKILEAGLSNAADTTANKDDNQNRLNAIETLLGIYVVENQLDTAIHLIDRELNNIGDPETKARLETSLGLLLFRLKGDKAQAKKRLQHALEQSENYAPARAGLTEVLIALGENDEALELVTNTIDSLETGQIPLDHAALVQCYISHARLLETQGNLADAYRRLTSALRQSPENLIVRHAIAHNRFSSQRWRDVLMATEQLEQRLPNLRDSFSSEELKLAADIFVLAARCEVELHRPDRSINNLHSALNLQPYHLSALSMIVGLLRDQKSTVLAADFATRLAEQIETPVESAVEYLNAGLLYRETTEAATLNELELATVEQNIVNRFETAFELLDGERAKGNSIQLPCEPLLQCFRASISDNRHIALRCLGYLLDEQLEDEERVELLLMGSELALSTEDPEYVALAETYARKAVALDTGSAIAVFRLASALELNGNVMAANDAIIKYCAESNVSDPGTIHSDLERFARVNLLRKLARIHEESPTLAIEALESARSLQGDSLEEEDYKRLATLFETLRLNGSTELDPARELANHRAIIELDPLYCPSLLALASHYQSNDDLNRAYECFRMIQRSDPDNPAALGFLEGHREYEDSGHDLDLDLVVGELPDDGGVPRALAQLWNYGATLLEEHLFDTDAEHAETHPIPITAKSIVSCSWGDINKRLNGTRINLIESEHNNFDPPDQLFGIRCLQPPTIWVAPQLNEWSSPAQVRFVLGQAVYWSRPEVILATGLEKQKFNTVTSALLLAFHPRYARKKSGSQLSNEEADRLSGNLSRRLPIRVARQIARAFKTHENQCFDSRSWRDWIRRSGHRVGLVFSGDLEAAASLVGHAADLPLREQIESNEDLRQLFAFALSEQYSSARRQIGFHVRKSH